MAVAGCEEQTKWPVHVFVFQDRDRGPHGQVDEIHKADPDELLTLSRLLALMPVSSSLPLPPSIIFLDAVEFPAIVRKKPVKRRNPVSKLNYSVSSADLTSPKRLFRVQGKLGRLKFDRTVELERGKVHLVQFAGGLFFVLTPDRGCLPKCLDATEPSKGEHREMPRLVNKTTPEFPEDAIAAFQRLGLRKTMVVLRCVIGMDGRVDPDTFVLLEAIHPSLVVSAWNEVSNNWRFEPGKKNGEPVDVWATVQVTYRLR